MLSPTMPGGWLSCPISIEKWVWQREVRCGKAHPTYDYDTQLSRMGTWKTSFSAGEGNVSLVSYWEYLDDLSVGDFILSCLGLVCIFQRCYDQSIAAILPPRTLFPYHPHKTIL